MGEISEMMRDGTLCEGCGKYLGRDVLSYCKKCAPKGRKGVLMTPKEKVDAALDEVLRASGSALKYYTMPSTLERMREAMNKIMTTSYTEGSGDNSQALKLAHEVERCYLMLLSEPDTKAALFKAENILRGAMADQAKGNQDCRKSPKGSDG